MSQIPLSTTFATGLFRIALTGLGVLAGTLLIIQAIDYAYERHLSNGGEEGHVVYAEGAKRGIPHPSTQQDNATESSESDEEWKERMQQYDSVECILNDTDEMDDSLDEYPRFRPGTPPPSENPWN